MKKYLFLLLPVLLFFIGCSDGTTLWTNETYTGKITVDDKFDEDTYFDRYIVGCGGTWEITLKSKDDVNMECNCWDETTNKRYYSKSTSDKITFTAKMPSSFHISICVDRDVIKLYGDAGYSLKAVIK